MTALPASQPQWAPGYRMEQLAAAFDRVMNPRDWKAPIRSVIPEAERDLVGQAVRWFTNTDPVFEPAPGQPDCLVVVALGYQLGLAQDDRADY